MHPAGEHLDRHGLGVDDRLQVGAVHRAGGLPQRLVQQVEVDDHAPLVEVVPADDDVEPVVVRVPLALGGGMPGMTWNARTCSAVPVSYTRY